MKPASTPDQPPELRFSAHYAWDLIELDYRAGILPLSNICMKYGVTMARLQSVAKKYGWSRFSVQPTVEEIYGAKQFNALPAPPGSVPISAEEVRVTAREQARLVLGTHRRDIEDLKSKLQDLMAKYEAMMCGQDPNGPGVPGSGPSLISPIGSKESAMDFLLKGSQVLIRVVGLERQAYGLDVLLDPSEDPEAQKTAEAAKDSVKELWDRIEAVAQAKASEAVVQSSPEPAPADKTKH